MRNPRARAAWLGVVVGATMLALGAARSNPVETPVADAVMRGDSAMVRRLIKQGLDVNASQPDGMSALHWAAQRGDAGAAQLLMYAGARVDAVTRNGNYTPLHLAARQGKTEAVKALLALREMVLAGELRESVGHDQLGWCDGVAFRRELR